ncbi:DUF262 domain-containing protein [Solwaraspora sp. WMMA2056]|uniref:DUF262 domain-containing protein n=1 Tax=Solwaraspora sp. WMMA2056 TaxID=3015161 RepID=UPI00259B58F5|nr:DUF262 domain-containing protein [Solwaraspora sp. WMMA2056]WJK41251.1 DUF262 domain-containing protein [Solwaraspora sp. WMMA2056]
MTQSAEQLNRPRSTNFYVPDLVDQGLKGQLRIPRFQRSFVWDEKDVLDLFDSLWRGFPIGTLLLWQKSAAAGAVEFGPLSIAVRERTDALWVVDGQQRITSLVGALNPTHRNVDKRFEVFFDLRRGRFATGGSSVPPTWLPVHRAVDSRSLLSWLREHVDDLEPDDYDAADALGGALRDYQVPAYIVSGDDDYLLRKIFDRVNSAGKPIGRADVFHALFASEAEPGSPQTVTEALSRLGFGIVDSDRVVQSLIALRGGNIQRDLRDEFDSGENAAEWYEKTEQALTLAITFLRKQGIPHLLLMPSTLPLPVLAAFFHLHPEPDSWTQRLLGRWLWRGWVHGFGRQGQTPALRQAIYSVNPKKGKPDLAPVEDRAALGLISSVVDEDSYNLRLHPFRTESSPARLAMLALASLHPLDLDGRPIDIGARLEEQGVGAVTELVPKRRGHVGARGFWPRNAGYPTGFEPSKILESHGITAEAAEALRARRIDDFVALRTAYIEDLLGRYVSSRVESKTLARPALSSLIVQDED